MAESITETIARAIIEAQGYSPSENELARARDEVPGIIAALTEAGYTIVPVEPTLAMLGEGAMQAGYCTSDFTAASACLPGHVYRAMINATSHHITPAIQTVGPIDSEKGE